jgi:hypothetical protein
MTAGQCRPDAEADFSGGGASGFGPPVYTLTRMLAMRWVDFARIWFIVSLLLGGGDIQNAMIVRDELLQRFPRTDLKDKRCGQI